MSGNSRKSGAFGKILLKKSEGFCTSRFPSGKAVGNKPRYSSMVVRSKWRNWSMRYRDMGSTSQLVCGPI